MSDEPRIEIQHRSGDFIHGDMIGVMGITRDRESQVADEIGILIEIQHHDGPKEVMVVLERRKDALDIAKVLQRIADIVWPQETT